MGLIDTFLESYHFAVLHPGTVHPLFFHNVGLFEPFGPHLREVFPRRTITELRERPESDWDLVAHTVVIYVLFPSTVLVMQGDHVEIWRVFPDSNRCDASVIHLDFYIPEPAETESARRHWDRNLDLVLRTVEEEDFPTGEGIQSGFRADAQAEILYGRNERPSSTGNAPYPRRSTSGLSGPVIEQKRPRPELVSLDTGRGRCAVAAAPLVQVAVNEAQSSDKTAARSTSRLPGCAARIERKTQSPLAARPPRAP